MSLNQEIEDLLNRLFIFEPEFKDEVRQKLEQGISEEKLVALAEILREAHEWQNEVLQRKLKDRPDLYEKIVRQKMELKHEQIREHLEAIKKEDKEKIDEIHLKIRGL
jgi:hypothetical protein